ncbi:MAG: calcium-binding protein [Nocardioidaceae bacterium]
MRARALTLAGATALFLTGFATVTITSSASAATSCTIVGTSGADKLIGTSGRDVICGLGGNDTISGLGGNDVIRGGAGSDTINGGGGTDTLVGGSGADTISGGTGADAVSGGLGGDTATGGGGGDTLSGGAGNDDLTGGSGADTINGGTGTNWCTVDAADVQHRCVYDETPPALATTTVSASRVDVTNADQDVTVRVHATDDTGITSVRVGPAEGDDPSYPVAFPDLHSGDVRDGWWTGTLTFPRWLEPGTYHVHVALMDRVRRHAGADVTDATIQVADANPDRNMPQAKLISPQPTDTYDARTSDTEVPVRARLTDDVSGVYHPEVCLHAPLGDYGYEIYASCASLRLRSGDRNDGVWSETVPIFRGQTGGDWDVEISVTDRAHGDGHQVSYWGPDEYHWKVDPDPAYDRPLADGLGRFTVLGPKRGDTVAPSVSSAAVTPSHVDTLAGDATVHLTVKASDVGGGVDGVYVDLLPAKSDDSSPDSPTASLDLASGTPASGTWTGSMTIPQGTPPQTYYLKVVAWDAAQHYHAYTSSGYPGTDSYEPLSTNPTVTVDNTAP